MKYFIILIAMTAIGSIASLFLKKASGAESFVKMLVNPWLYVGGGLYLLSAVLNIYILRYLEYSVVLPLTAITYIWTMVLSYLVLKERITIKKMGGVLLIVAGAVLVSM